MSDLTDLSDLPIAKNPIDKNNLAFFFHLETFAGIDGNSCYYPVFSGTALNWTEAEKACQNLHSRYHLISLETDEVKR